MLSPQEQLKNLYAQKGELVTNLEMLQNNLARINDQIGAVRQAMQQSMGQVNQRPPIPPKEDAKLVDLAREKMKKGKTKSLKRKKTNPNSDPTPDSAIEKEDKSGK